MEWDEIIRNPDILNNNIVLEEGILNTFKKMIDTVYKHSKTLNKHSHDGLISQLKSATTNGWKFIKAAFQLYNKKITKDEFETKWHSLKPHKKEIMHFLINLDILTLHLITGPIEIIGVITGIHIDEIIADKLKNDGIKSDKDTGLIANLYSITKQLKDKVESILTGEHKEKAETAILNLAASLPGPTPEEFGLK